jgi:hypothetical protein
MFALQQNLRTRGQNRFCLEMGSSGAGGPNNVKMIKKNPKKNNKLALTGAKMLKKKKKRKEKHKL